MQATIAVLSEDTLPKAGTLFMMCWSSRERFRYYGGSDVEIDRRWGTSEEVKADKGWRGGIKEVGDVQGEKKQEGQEGVR